MKPYALAIEIEHLPKLPNQLLGAHWTVRSGHAKKWRVLVKLNVNSKRPKSPLPKAMVRLTRVSSVRPDHDGLVGSFKAVIDGLKHAGVIIDDTHEVIGQPEYNHEKGKPGAGLIKIEVLELREESVA